MKKYEQINVDNVVNAIIHVMGIDNDENLQELNEYIEDKGIEEVIIRILKVYCTDGL